MYFNKIMVIKSVFVTPSKRIHDFSKITKFCNKPKYVNMCSVNTYSIPEVPKHLSRAWTFKISHGLYPVTIDKIVEQSGHFAHKLKLLQVTPIFFNFTFDKGRLKNLVSWTLQNYGKYKTLELLEQLKKTGFEYATKAGISLGIDDLKIPPKKKSLLLSAEKLTKSTVQQYERGEITAVERFQRLIDTWHRTSEQLKQEVIAHFEETDILNPVYMMAFSGARGNISQVRQLVGMRGLMSDPQGQIIDFPIRSNFREGLTLTEYIISSYGARKGIVDTALRTANAGYLTRRLVDVAQHVMISHYDCGTLKGIFLTDMKEGNKTLVSVQNRIVGRVLARDIFKPNTTIKIASRNQEITTDLAFEIKKITNRVFVRSSLTCNTNKLLCQLCYGWSLAQGNLVSVGEAVGVIAAQSIGEPGTQLTMRTFHTGGVFSGDISDEIRAPYNGFIHYENQIPGILIRTIDGKIRFLTKADGVLFFSLSSKSYFSTTQDLDVRKFKIPAYTILFMRNTEEVIKKQVVAQITSINTKLNIRDTAEFVIKAELEGVFYGKRLEISKKILGPKPKIGGFGVTLQLEYNGINPKAMEIIVKARGWNFGWVLSGKRYETPLLLKLFPSIGDYVNNQTIMARHNLQVPKNYSVSQLNNTSNIYVAKGAARFFFSLSDTLKSKPSNQKLTKRDTFNLWQVWDQNKKTKNNTKNAITVRSNFSKIKKFFLFKIFSNPALIKHSGKAHSKEQGQQIKSLQAFSRLKTLTKTKASSLHNLGHAQVAVVKSTEGPLTPTALKTKAKTRKKVLNNKLNKLIRFPSRYQEKYLNSTIKLNSQFSRIKALITKKLFSGRVTPEPSQIETQVSSCLSREVLRGSSATSLLPQAKPVVTSWNPGYNGLYQDQKTKTNFSSKIKQNSFGLKENLAINKIFIKQDLVFLNTRKIKYYKIGYFHFINKQHNLNNIPTLFFNKDKQTCANAQASNNDKIMEQRSKCLPPSFLDLGRGQVILLSPSALKKEYILDREIKLKRIKSLSYLVESSCLDLLNHKENLALFTKKKPLMKPYPFNKNSKTANLFIPKEKYPINIAKDLPNTKSIQSVCPILYKNNTAGADKVVKKKPHTNIFTPNKKNQLAFSTSLLQTKINFSKHLFIKILQLDKQVLKKVNGLAKQAPIGPKDPSVPLTGSAGRRSKVLKDLPEEQKNIMLFTLIKNTPDFVLIKRKIKKYKKMYKTNTLAMFNKTDKLTKHLNSLKNFRFHTEKKNNILFSEMQRAISLPLVLQKTKTSLQALLYKTYLKETFKRVWKPELEVPKETQLIKPQARQKGLGFIIILKDKKLLDLQDKNFFPTNYVLYKKSAVSRQPLGRFLCTSSVRNLETFAQEKIRDTFSDLTINNFIFKKQIPCKDSRWLVHQAEGNILSNKVKAVFEYIVPSETINGQTLGLTGTRYQQAKPARLQMEQLVLTRKQDTSILRLKQQRSLEDLLENTKKILKHFKKNKIKKVNLHTAKKLNAVELQKSNYINYNLLENKNYIKSIMESSCSRYGSQATPVQAKTKITKKLLKYTISRSLLPQAKPVVTRKWYNTDQITTKLISFFKKAFMLDNRTFKIKNALKKLIINKRKFLLTQKQIAYILMYFQLKQKHIFNLEYFKQLKNINVSYKSIIENVKKANRSKTGGGLFTKPKKNKTLQVIKICQTKRFKVWLKKTKLTSTYSYQSILLTTKSNNSPSHINFALIKNKGVRFLQKNKLNMNIGVSRNIFLTKFNGRKKINLLQNPSGQPLGRGPSRVTRSSPRTTGSKQKLKKAKKAIGTKNINFQDRHFNGVDLNNLKQNKKNPTSLIAHRAVGGLFTKPVLHEHASYRHQDASWNRQDRRWLVYQAGEPKVHGDSRKQRTKVKRLQEHSFLETNPKISKKNIYELVYIVLYNNKTELNAKPTTPSWIYKTKNPLDHSKTQVSSSARYWLRDNPATSTRNVLIKNKAINTGFNTLTMYPGYSNFDTLLFNNIAIQPCFNVEKKHYLPVCIKKFNICFQVAHATSYIKTSKWPKNFLSKHPNALKSYNIPKVGDTTGEGQLEIKSKKIIRKKQISITKKLRENYEILINLLEKQPNSVGTNKELNKSLFVKDFNFSILPEIFKQNLVWVKNKNPRFLPKHLEQKTQSFKSVTKSPENQLTFNHAEPPADTNASRLPEAFSKDRQTVALIFKQIASANSNTFFVPGLDVSKQQITKYSLILYLNYLYKLNKINLGLENRPNKKTLILYLKNLKTNLKEILSKKTLHYILFKKLPEVNIMVDTGLQKLNKKKTGLKLIKSSNNLNSGTAEVAELRLGKILDKLSYNTTRNKQHLAHSKTKIKQIKKLQRHFYTYIFQDYKDKTYTNYYSKQKKDLNLLKKNPRFAQSIVSFQIHRKVDDVSKLRTLLVHKDAQVAVEKQIIKNSILRKVNSSKLVSSNARSFNSLDTKQKNNKKIKLKQSLKSSTQSNQNYKKLISYTNLPFFSNLFKTSSYEFTYTAKNSKLLNLYNLHSKTKLSIIPNQPCLNFVSGLMSAAFLNLIKNKQTSNNNLKNLVGLPRNKPVSTASASLEAAKRAYDSKMLSIVTGGTAKVLKTSKWPSFNRQKYKPSNTLFLKKLEGVSNFLARTNFYSPFEGELLQIKPYKKYLELNPYKNIKTGLFSFNKNNTKDSQIRLAMFKYYLKNININKTIIKKGWSRFNLILTKNDLLAFNYTKNHITFKKGDPISVEQNITVFSEIHAMSVNKRNVVLITPKITLAQACFNYLVKNNVNNYFKIKTLADLNKQNHFTNKSYSLLKNMWLNKTLLVTKKKENNVSSGTAKARHTNVSVVVLKDKDLDVDQAGLPEASRCIKKINSYKIKIYLPSSHKTWPVSSNNLNSGTVCAFSTENKLNQVTSNYPFKEAVSQMAKINPGKFYYQKTISLAYLNKMTKRKKAQAYFFFVYNSILNFNWLFCKQRHLLTKNKIGFFLLKGNRFINSSNKITNMLFNNFIFLNKIIYNLENMTILLQDSRCLDFMLSLELQKLHLNNNCLSLKPLQDKSQFLKTIKQYSLFTKISSKNRILNNNKSICDKHIKTSNWPDWFLHKDIVNLTLWEAFVPDLHFSKTTTLTFDKNPNGLVFTKAWPIKTFSVRALVLHSLNIATFVNYYKKQKFYLQANNITTYSKNLAKSYKFFNYIKLLNINSINYIQIEILIKNLLSQFLENKNSKTLHKDIAFTTQQALMPVAAPGIHQELVGSFFTNLVNLQDLAQLRKLLAYAWKTNPFSVLTKTGLTEPVKNLLNNKTKQILIKNYKQLGKQATYGHKSKSCTISRVTPEAISRATGNKIFLVIKKSGQILQMNQQKLTIRLGQPLVISPRSIIHGTHGDFITNKTAVVTLTYLKLKTGDIVQGIPKIEQLFEARTTKRGRLFRDNVSNLLTGLFLKYFIQSTYILRTQTTVKTLENGVSQEGFLDKENNKQPANNLNSFQLHASRRHLERTKKINNKLYNQFLNNKHNLVTKTYRATSSEKSILALALQWSVKQSFYKIQQIIVDGILRVYRSQGVSIADKHVEIIVKQMTSKVRIINASKFKMNEYKFSLKTITRNLNTEINQPRQSQAENRKTKQRSSKKTTDQNTLLEQLLSNNFDGPTGLFPGEIVDIDFVENINNYLFKTSSLVKNSRFEFLFTAQQQGFPEAANAFAVEPIKYEPIVLGITRASLEVESFLSAASFQQTTKVLSQAALYKKKDFLKGLKENIIIGNLIPTGTGYLSSINF